MKYLNKFASVFIVALLGVLTLTGCEGADLHNIASPSWLNDKVDSIANSKKTTIVNVVPNPQVLGADDYSSEFFIPQTDDIKIEPGTSAQVKFINYGGAMNWNNFLIVLRDESKALEYAVLRADNWGWGTNFSADDQDFNYTRKIENDRDWGAWLKSMSMAKCTATISNPGDGTASVKISMLGADGANYSQEYNDIIGINKDNLYFAFTVDHSYIEFGDIDIVDSEPVSMTLTAVPDEVLIGTPIEEAMANVTATVTFANGATKDIENKDLQFEAIPDYGSLGQKTLIVLYNKTYLGAAPEKAVIASKTFSVVNELSSYTATYVVPTPLVLGKEDNTSAPWYEIHTDHIKVAPKETKIISFTNYSAGVHNYDNFLIRLTNEAWTSYCVVRADDFGWDSGYGACQHYYENGRDWDGWLPAMNGAKVTAYITNNGDGTADIKLTMVGNNNLTYTQDYIGINTINPDDMWFDVCIENAHVIFDNVIGALDNTTPWSDNPVATSSFKVEGKQVCTFNFTNYTAGGGWYQNFMVILNRKSLVQYAVLRADNWGWGDSYLKATRNPEEGRVWEEWYAAMNGAKVTLTINNKGDGTADVKAIMQGTDGKTYTQDYIGLTGIDADDFYVRLSVDHSHSIFE